MKILVTGAQGFVGQALLLHMQSFGWELISAARSCSSTCVGVGEIDARTDWSKALLGCTAIVHLAARVHVMRDTVDDPLAEFRRVNVEGTHNLARQAADAGVRRFVLVSSIKVNGETTTSGIAFTPKDEPAPQDAYAISKLEAEQVLHEVCRASGMEFVVIRAPLVYGPGVKGNFQALLRWVQAGIPLPLGAVVNCRSLVALDNLTDLISRCLTHPSAANQILLAADGEDVSTPDLLLKIAAAYNKPSRLIPVPAIWLRSAAAMLGKQAAMDRLLGSLVIDISKTCNLLGWTPSVSMDEQLRKMARDDSRS